MLLPFQFSSVIFGWNIFFWRKKGDGTREFETRGDLGSWARLDFAIRKTSGPEKELKSEQKRWNSIFVKTGSCFVRSFSTNLRFWFERDRCLLGLALVCLFCFSLFSRWLTCTWWWQKTSLTFACLLLLQFITPQPKTLFVLCLYLVAVGVLPSLTFLPVGLNDSVLNHQNLGDPFGFRQVQIKPTLSNDIFVNLGNELV